MVVLATLRIDLRGLNEKAKEDLGRDWYKNVYLIEPGKPNIGIHELHDGERVIFHATSFDHAFFKSSNYTLHPKRKDLIDDRRVEKVRWIGPLLSGLVPNSSCWEVCALNGRPGIPNRVYVAHDQCYLVFLEPRAETDPVKWKFSSAFPTFPKYIQEKVMVGTMLWTNRWV